MADNNRGRPVMMTEIFILLAGNKKFPKGLPATEQTKQIHHVVELRDSKIVLNEQVVLLNKINIETVEGQVEPLHPMKILTAIIMSIVIFTVPQKIKKNGGGNDFTSQKKKKS